MRLVTIRRLGGWTKNPAVAGGACVTERDNEANFHVVPIDRNPQMRVLVADDNRDAAESLATLFHLTGHQVRMAFDGGQAVEQARDWTPDVAVLDIKMPVLDGRDVARTLRARFPDLVLVALSGQLSQRDLELCRALFDLCFAKGVEFREFYDRIVAAMHDRHPPRSAH
jgi:CheY-like chemotaxis protein